MKRTILLPLVLNLFPFGLLAQSEVPKDIPMQGKVLSYEIFEVYGDSLNPKESSLEKATYDKNGRILESRKGGIGIGEQPFLKKHIYTPGKEVVYECQCKNIEPFIKEFVIHDRNELKNKPRYGTNHGPTHWVTINTLNKKGNVIHSAHYSGKGYRTHDVWFEYTTTNKIRTYTVYDMDSVLTLTEKNKYDVRGNLIEKTVHGKGAGESQEILVYDAQNNLVEKQYFEQKKIRIHLAYTVKFSGTTKEFITTDRLTDSNYVEKAVTYNARNQKIKQQKFESGGGSPHLTLWEYYDNGNIKSISYYNGEGKLNHKAEYEYDSRNNWKVAYISKRVTVQEKAGNREEMRKTKYVQKIVYDH